MSSSNQEFRHLQAKMKWFVVVVKFLKMQQEKKKSAIFQIYLHQTATYEPHHNKTSLPGF